MPSSSSDTPSPTGETRPERTPTRRFRARTVLALSLTAVITLVGTPLVAAHADDASGAAAAMMRTLDPQARAAHEAALAQQAAAEQAAALAHAQHQARLDFPPVTAAAASVTGLTGAAAPETAAQVGSGVQVTPAIAARLAAEARGARAAARAQLGAEPGFSRPVEEVRKSSGFGPRWGRHHAGVDYSGEVGTHIRSVAAGTVTVAEAQSGYGNMIEVEHADGTRTRYAHLDRMRVKAGDEVDVAQIIGHLGNTGRSTGPHLHFEVRTADGEAMDPVPWLHDRGISPLQ